MKCKFAAFLLAALLSGMLSFLPASAEEKFSDSATQQVFYSLTAYSRMCNGQSPLYVLDSGKGEKTGYQKQGSVDQVQSLIDGIVAFKTGNVSVQRWIDSGLVKDVDKGAEWYAVAFSQSGEYNFSAYGKALLQYLKENMPSAVQTAQKYALALIAAGSKDGVIQEIADRPIVDLPVMAQVFGLHLLNNGVISCSYTVEEVKKQLLSMQRKDGGWAITGQYGDVDVTAMVLQALAPHAKDPAIRAAADRAVALLSARQNADGTFSTMGVANCESTAQVIAALSDWRIDCASDARFAKNGKTPIDGLQIFRRADGSFSHIAPKESVKRENQHTSLVSDHEKSPDKTESLTDQKNPSSDHVSKEEKTGSSAKETDAEDQVQVAAEDLTPGAEENKKKEKNTEKKESSDFSIGYKPFVAIALLIFAAGAAALLFRFKKATRKNFLLLCLIFLALLGFVFATNFESVKTHNTVKTKSNVVGAVTLSIRCDTVAGKGDPDFIPRDGILLKETEFEIETGDTVYDVLEEASKRFSIHMEKKGTDGFVYVAAIGHLYELQFGECSGWVYHVNGVSPFVGCDSFTVSAGDKIEWMYTLDLGADVGNTFEAKGGG